MESRTSALNDDPASARRRMTMNRPEAASRAAELRAGLERGEFVPYYQPIVDRSTGTVVAFEALARWCRQDRVLAPVEFLDDIETCGLQHLLAARMFIAAVRDVDDLRAGRFVANQVRVHVNVSAGQLDHERRIDQVRSCIERNGYSIAGLTIELTETCALNAPLLAASMLARCRQHGVPVALDDVGAGYASLSLLRLVAVDELKIDRWFITDIAHDTACQAVVAGIVEITRRLGIVATAEGVETPAQDKMLRDLGVDRLQGYLYGKPVCLDELRDGLSSCSGPSALH